MRTNEERTLAVKLRASEMKRQRQKRKNNVISVCAVTACLALIVRMAIWMPEAVKSIDVQEFTDYMGTASIFAGSSLSGYIVIGLVAFALGICVTLLCVKLHNLNRSGDKDDRDCD